MDEQRLTEKAIAYLKAHYGEDTVRMNIMRNDVAGGNGVLEVDCTVSVGGSHSDWSKWFLFRNGEVASMRWNMR